MKIQSIQNERASILKIAAARRLYSIAKKYNNAFIMLNIVLVSALTLFSICLNSAILAQKFSFTQMDISNWVAVASIIVLSLNKLVIGNGIDTNREKAAKIQEQLDRLLFKLNWNSALAGNEPRIEDIVRHGEWYIEKYGCTGLENWYSLKSTAIEHYHQVLICQNSSLYWDVSLRKKINTSVVIGGIIIFSLALSASLYFNLPTAAALTNLAALLGPILDYGYSTMKENKESIEHSERLLECINSSIEKAESGASEETLRRSTEAIQDQIFVKRKGDWLIPDLFYKFLRNKDELVMQQSSAQLEAKFEGIQRP